RELEAALVAKGRDDVPASFPILAALGRALAETRREAAELASSLGPRHPDHEAADMKAAALERKIAEQRATELAAAKASVAALGAAPKTDRLTLVRLATDRLTGLDLAHVAAG